MPTYVCDSCNKSYRRKYSYEKHIETCIKKIIYHSCSNCDESIDIELLVPHLIECYGKTHRGSLVSFVGEGLFGNYLLTAIIDDSCTLKDIDTFLRKIWYDCCNKCNHLSTFKNMFTGENISKKKLYGMSHMIPITYTFDVVYPTDLQIVQMGKLKGKQSVNKIKLTEQYEEPIIGLCNNCKINKATHIDNNSNKCISCVIDINSSIKITNTPRTGICGKHCGFSYERFVDKTFTDKLGNLNDDELIVIDMLFNLLDDKKTYKNGIHQFKQLLLS
jgi:hypothetical protein